MPKKALFVLSVLACLVAASPAAAHMLWVNLYESHVHKPGHAIASIGWGHMIPMDDVVDGVGVESYSLVDPDAKTTALTLPAHGEQAPPKSKASGMLIQDGDLGVRKITLSEESKPGTYQVALVGKDNYYTNFIDQKGRKRWATKPMDQVKEAQKVLGAMFYKGYAKSCFKVKEWSQPKPLGHDLEIMPLTDLSNVRVGDKVDFKITFMGKPVTTSPEKSIEYITATSNTFGGPDKFTLAAIIFGGKGSFRIPTAGQWVVNVYHRQMVAENPDLKHLAKKCYVVLRAATISFNVKP
jgi:uncharacterized GH25 family protein